MPPPRLLSQCTSKSLVYTYSYVCYSPTQSIIYVPLPVIIHMYVTIYTYSYVCYIFICMLHIHMYVTIHHLCSLTGKYISQKCLLIVQYKYLKSCSEDFILKNLILRTRSCGTAFITQRSWLFHFHQAEICLVEMFCTTVVPASKGHLRGASP